MGLKHVPTPKQTTKEELLNELSVFRNKLGWSYFFYIKDKQRPDNSLEKPILPKQSGKQFHFKVPFDKPLQLTNELEDYIEAIDESFPAVPSLNPIKNLSEFLTKNSEIKIVATDKNLGMAAFDIQDYNEMVLTHLTTTNYTLINNQADTAPIFNQAFQRSRRSLVTLIDTLKENNSVPLQYKDALTAFEKHSKVKLPYFHVLPKLHKIKTPNSIIPSRPIVGATNWFTTPVSKILSRLLRPIISTQDHIATNTFDVTTALTFFDNFHSRLFKNPNHPIFIVTMDISSLYTNIDLPTLKRLMHTQNPDLESLLTYINDHNYFQYDKRTFKQTNGIAMGTNAAPEIANYYLLHLLDPSINLNPKVKLYKRFLDDLLILWNGSYAEFVQFFVYLNGLVPGIEFTYEISPDSGNFLDLQINVSKFGSTPAKLTYSTHQKALNKYAYISPKSCHPVHTLKGFIFGELQRYSTNSSNQFYYATTKRLFKQRLMARGYSRQFLEPLFKKHHFQDHLRHDNIKRPSSLLNMSIRYSYRSKIHRISRTVRNQSRLAIQKLIPDTKFLISWKKSPNLFNKLCSSKLTLSQSEAIAARNSTTFNRRDGAF